MAEDVAGVDLAQNVFNGHSGTNHVRRVVHRKNDAGHDLNVQTDAAKATEFPKDVQVTRGWIVVKVAMTGRKSGLFQKRPRMRGSIGPILGMAMMSNRYRKRFGVQSRISPHWTRHSLGHILYAQPNPRRDERGISSLLLSMPSYATTAAGA